MIQFVTVSVNCSDKLGLDDTLPGAWEGPSRTPSVCRAQTIFGRKPTVDYRRQGDVYLDYLREAGSGFIDVGAEDLVLQSLFLLIPERPQE